MRIEDIKNDIPETPEYIHRMIQGEVKRQLEDENTVISIEKNKKRVHKWSGVRVAAAAMIGILVTSSVAYAGTKLYHIYFEKQGTYSVTTGITTKNHNKGNNTKGNVVKDDQSEKKQSNTMGLPKEVHEINIKTNYIPKGMKWTDDMHLSYMKTPYEGGFTFQTVLLDDNNLDKALTDKNVVESEKMTFGSRDGVYLRYQRIQEGVSFNQRIYLVCPEQQRVIVIYIGENVSKEDAIKVAENVSLVETKAMVKTEQLTKWSDIVSTRVHIRTDRKTSVAESELKVLDIGDELKLKGHGEDEAGKWIDSEDISASVDSVKIADDLKGLDQNKLPEEWKKAIDKNGKLVKNRLSFIKTGDGVESLDKVVKTMDVNQKLVTVDVTFKNNDKRTMNHMLYLANLMLINHQNRQYEIYHSDNISGEGYDRIIGDSVARANEMTYYSISEKYGNGGNYIPRLKSGESVKVKMAWIINEDDLPNMYLDLTGGGGYEFSEDAIKTGVVNICQ